MLKKNFFKKLELTRASFPLQFLLNRQNHEEKNKMEISEVFIFQRLLFVLSI